MNNYKILCATSRNGWTAKTCVYPWGELRCQAESDDTNAILSEIWGSAKEHLQDQGLLSQDREHTVNFHPAQEENLATADQLPSFSAPIKCSQSHSVSVGVFQVKDTM